MKRQDYNLQILEMDNKTNEILNPIREEIAVIGADIDENKIDRQKLRMRMDAVMSRMSEIDSSLCEIKMRYNEKRFDAQEKMRISEITREEFDRINVEIANDINKETETLKKERWTANSTLKELKTQLGMIDLDILNLFARLNRKNTDLKRIAREEWFKKHDFIVRYSNDLED